MQDAAGGHREMRQYGRIYDASAPWRAAHLARGGGCTLCCSCSRRRFKHSSSPVGPSTELSRASAQSPPLGLLGLVLVLVITAVAVAALVAMPLLLLLLLLRTRVGPKARSAMARQWPGSGQAGASLDQSQARREAGGRQAGGSRGARCANGKGRGVAMCGGAWRAFLCFFFLSCFSSLCFLSASSSESLLSLLSELLSRSRFFFSFFSFLSFFAFCGAGAHRCWAMRQLEGHAAAGAWPQRAQAGTGGHRRAQAGWPGGLCGEAPASRPKFETGGRVPFRAYASCACSRRRCCQRLLLAAAARLVWPAPAAAPPASVVAAAAAVAAPQLCVPRLRACVSSPQEEPGRGSAATHQGRWWLERIVVHADLPSGLCDPG